LDQISEDLRQREIAKTINPEMKSTRENLPVFQYKQQIVDAVEHNHVVLIKGATGCGKSTQVISFSLSFFNPFHTSGNSDF
jgi:HrpA-like RNA helicase